MVSAAMKLKDAYSLEGKLGSTWIAYEKAEIQLVTFKNVTETSIIIHYSLLFF